MLTQLGPNIRRARKARGHTQESLARVLGTSVRAVGHWELGETVPNRRNLEALAAELVQTPAWFYTEHDDEPVAA